MQTHPRDALIEFDAGPHKYTCMGEADYMSVTTWNHSHFPQFDADAIIAKMNLANPKCKYYGQTPEQIKAGWNKGRDEAAEAGTELHAAIETFWIGGAPLEPPLRGGLEGGADLGAEGGADLGAEGGSDLGVADALSPQLHAQALTQPLTQDPTQDPTQAPTQAPTPDRGARGVSPLFEAFVADHPHLKPYRAEWMIFDEDVRLAGSIDFVAENPDGTLTIYDWKRCKEIKKTNSFGVFALTECISHLPDTNYWHYVLQLNTYKTILERKYAKTVKNMFLVGLHPNLPNYQVYTVPNLTNEMIELFDLRASQR